MADTATRYSGGAVISLRYEDAPKHGRNGGYSVVITRAGGGKHRVAVAAPAHITKAVDGAEAFDDAAHAALSFAEHDGFDTGATGSGSGWDIQRRKPSQKIPKAPARLKRGKCC